MVYTAVYEFPTAVKQSVYTWVCALSNGASHPQKCNQLNANSAQSETQDHGNPLSDACMKITYH